MIQKTWMKRKGIVRKIDPVHIKGNWVLGWLAQRRSQPASLMTINLRKWLYSLQSTFLNIFFDSYNLVAETKSCYVPCEAVFLPPGSLVGSHSRGYHTVYPQSFFIPTLHEERLGFLGQDQKERRMSIFICNSRKMGFSFHHSGCRQRLCSEICRRNGSPLGTCWCTDSSLEAQGYFSLTQSTPTPPSFTGIFKSAKIGL